MSAASVTLSPADAQGIATLTLCNPGKMNALDTAMWRQLRTLAEGLATAPSPPRVLVLRGADGQFVAGGDIAEFPQFRFQPETLAAFHEDLVAPALEALLALDLPLIAHIEGACVGGGLEIAACCDLRLADSDARLGVPIARLGFPLAPRELEIVAGRIGATLLRELLIDARLLDADEALRKGLLTRVCAPADLAAEVAATARRIAGLSPQAMRLNKQALRTFAGPGTGTGAGTASTAAQRAPHYAYADTDEHREGLAAFIARRPPRF